MTMLRNLGLGMLSVAFLFTAGTAYAAAGIEGTAHDFGSTGTGVGAALVGEICVVCHTPHEGNMTLGAPLWDRAETVATFTAYSGQGTYNATFSTISGVTKLCLSCHDGTIALDATVSNGGTGTLSLSSGDAGFLGNDLSNDHPVSILYDAALVTADGGGLVDPSTGPVQALLFGTQVECASCHDVHNDLDIPKLLTVSNADSALCLTCHLK